MLEESHLEKGVRMGEVRHVLCCLTGFSDSNGFFVAGCGYRQALEGRHHNARRDPMSVVAYDNWRTGSLHPSRSFGIRVPHSHRGFGYQHSSDPLSCQHSMTVSRCLPFSRELNLPVLINQAREVMEELSRDVESSMRRDSPGPSLSPLATDRKSEAGKFEEELGVYDDLVEVLRKAEEGEGGRGDDCCCCPG